MLPRIAAVSIVLTALLAYGLKRAMPELEFDWAGKFALSFGAVLLSLLCFCGLSSLIPPIIGIKKQGVTRQEGQHVSWRRRADIRRITIDITDPARPRLNIEATNKGPFECGIASKVKAASLADFLRATFPELKVEVNG